MSALKHTTSPAEFQGGGEASLGPGRRIPAGELLFRFSRSGGPGGQNVNKVASRVELLFHPGSSRVFTKEELERILVELGGRIDDRGYIHVVSDESRSQWENRLRAVEKLSSMLARALRPRKRRRPTRATAGSRSRKRVAKEKLSAKKRGRRPGISDDSE